MSRSRRAAGELAGHRRRLLDLADAALSFPHDRPADFPSSPLATAADPDLDPNDAILLRVGASSPATRLHNEHHASSAGSSASGGLTELSAQPAGFWPRSTGPAEPFSAGVTTQGEATS